MEVSLFYNFNFKIHVKKFSVHCLNIVYVVYMLNSSGFFCNHYKIAFSERDLFFHFRVIFQFLVRLKAWLSVQIHVRGHMS